MKKILLTTILGLLFSASIASAASFECDFPHEGDLEISGAGCVIPAGKETGIDAGNISIASGATMQMEEDTELIFEPGQQIAVGGYILRPKPRNAIIRKEPYEIPKPFAICDPGSTVVGASGLIAGHLYGATTCGIHGLSEDLIDISTKNQETASCQPNRFWSTNATGGDSKIRQAASITSGGPGVPGILTPLCTLDGNNPTVLDECPFGYEELGAVLGKSSGCLWDNGFSQVGTDITGSARCTLQSSPASYVVEDFYTEDALVACSTISRSKNWRYGAATCNLCRATSLPNKKRAFVTSQKQDFSSQLDDIDAMNAVCQATGNAVDPSATWRAWYSTNTVDAKDNIECSGDKRYVDLNDNTIAYSCTGLLGTALTASEPRAKNLHTAIKTTENGVIDSPFHAEALTLTHTDVHGQYVPQCQFGSALFEGGFWTQAPSYIAPNNCSQLARLYCFEV